MLINKVGSISMLLLKQIWCTNVKGLTVALVFFAITIRIVCRVAVLYCSTYFKNRSIYSEADLEFLEHECTTTSNGNK